MTRLAWTLGSMLVSSSALHAQCEVQVLEALNPPGDLSDNFGISLAANGAVAVVGEPLDGANDRGAVWIFDRSGDSWVKGDKLFGSQGGNTRTGWDVSVDGNALIAGAPSTHGSGYRNGAAYLFERGPTGWTQAGLFFNPVTTNDLDDPPRLGTYVDIEGDLAAASTAMTNSAQDTTTIFERTPLGWELAATVSARGPVAVTGETVFVRLEAWEKQPNGTWVSATVVHDPVVDWGGIDAAGGDTLAYGSPDEPTGLGWNGGVVVILEKIAGTWTETDRIIAADPDWARQFGTSIAIDTEGARMAIGSDEAVYLYERNAAGEWHFRSKIMQRGYTPVVPSGSYFWQGSEFGQQVAVSGRTVFGYTYASPLTPRYPGVLVYEDEEFATPFCFCNTGPPCANRDSAAGCENSTQLGARLFACGSASVSEDDLILSIEHAPSLQTATIFLSTGTVALPFGDGKRCVGGGAGLARLLNRTTSPGGILTEGPGILALSGQLGNLLAQVLAGDTWNFQCAFRDQEVCGFDINASNALAVTFGP